MVDLGNEVRRIFDPIEPVGFDEIQATSRRRRRRHHRMLASSAASVIAAVVVTLLLTGGMNSTRVTVGPAFTQPSAPQTSTLTPTTSAPLYATLKLSEASVPAGGTVAGEVIVENDTGAALHPVTCGLYQAALASNGYEPSISWPLCARRTTIPVGRSSYPVSIAARYYNCVPSNSPPCVDQRPLPPGTYQAKVFASSPNLPLPASLKVTVTPS